MGIFRKVPVANDGRSRCRVCLVVSVSVACRKPLERTNNNPILNEYLSSRIPEIQIA
jgi:hypothetical protein